MNVSEVIAGFLKRAGVGCVFGYPGDPSVEFLEGARRQELDFVLATREGTAGLMAEAYGMITGKPGVALSTLGPGSTNLVNPVANAFLGSMGELVVADGIGVLRTDLFVEIDIPASMIFPSGYRHHPGVKLIITPH